MDSGFVLFCFFGIWHHCLLFGGEMAPFSLLPSDGDSEGLPVPARALLGSALTGTEP